MTSSLTLRRSRLGVGTLLAAMAAGCGSIAAPAAQFRPQTEPAEAAGARNASGARALKMIWGPVTLPSGRSAFPVYHRLGVDVLQLDLIWADTAHRRPRDAEDPRDPAYQWSAAVERAVTEAQRYRIRISLLVQGSPGWANGDRPPARAPDHSSDFGQFLIAASRRFPSVRHWMIWGEPNRNQASPDFQPMPPNSPVGPRRYALLLNAAYHALKSVSRHNVVIGGDTWSFGAVEPADFVKWMRLPNGAPPPLDLYGHNPFGRRFPNLRAGPYFPGGRDIDDVDTLHAQLARIYHRSVHLWLSEFTVSSDHNNVAFDFHVTRQEQAQWLTAAFHLVDSTGYVAGLGWFNLLDSAPSNAEHLTQGLLDWRGKPKPAYSAYQRVP